DRAGRSCALASETSGRAIAVTYLELPARDKSGATHIVVENPRGVRAKFKYGPGFGVFTLSRKLRRGAREDEAEVERCVRRFRGWTARMRCGGRGQKAGSVTG